MTSGFEPEEVIVHTFHNSDHLNVRFQSMRRTKTAVLILGILGLFGCNIAPYTFPESGPQKKLQAIDATRIRVKAEFRYLPTFTSYVFPAGEYIPVRADGMGTFYESPRGILVQATTGSFLVRGGIYRASDEPLCLHARVGPNAVSFA